MGRLSDELPFRCSAEDEAESAALSDGREEDGLLAGGSGRRPPGLARPALLAVGAAAAALVAGTAIVAAHSSRGGRQTSDTVQVIRKQEYYDVSADQEAYADWDDYAGQTSSAAGQDYAWPGEAAPDAYDGQSAYTGQDNDVSSWSGTSSVDLGYALQQRQQWPDKESVLTASPTPAPLPCGWLEEDVFYPGNDLESFSGVLSADDCCSKCAENETCFAWSYKKFTQECMLKGNQPLNAITKLPDPMYTSGQPTQVRKAIPLVVPKPGESTLYCWSLMLPGSMEPVLLRWQFDHRVSLFRCDEYDVFSNTTLMVAPGFKSKTVVSDLHCEKGGEFGTALNTEIFITVWRALVADGRYKFHDWTVKVDPDSVFFAPRLRTILSKYMPEVPAAPNGMYLNNCHRGMHGPVEVLSKKAVQTWFRGISQCQEHFVRLCSGDCQWGEDMFMDQCLMKVLNVDRRNNSKVLVEEACDPPEDWRQCQNDQIVSYHPFKDIESYKNCLRNSGSVLLSA